MRRIIVGITGASGAIYGFRALEVLSKVGDVETHLIVSKGAATTAVHELERPLTDITGFADCGHDGGRAPAPPRAPAVDDRGSRGRCGHLPPGARHVQPTDVDRRPRRPHHHAGVR